MDDKNISTLTAAIAELTISVKELTVAMQKPKRKVRQKKSINITNELDNKLNNNNIYNNNIYNSKNRAKNDTSMELDIRSVIEHYRTYHPRALRTLLSRWGEPSVTKSKTYLAIQDRLRQGYTVAELISAIDGMHKSPFHLGHNKQGTKYLGLELCMRNGEHVESFMAVSEEGTKPKLGINTIKTAQAAKQWLGE